MFLILFKKIQIFFITCQIFGVTRDIVNGEVTMPRVSASLFASDVSTFVCDLGNDIWLKNILSPFNLGY